MIKKVTKKTVRITKPELDKCHANQEFEANVITCVKPKPPIVETDDIDEPIIHGDPSDRNLQPPQPKPPRPSLVTVVKMLTVMQGDITDLKDDVSILKTGMSDLKIRMTNVETKLSNVITLNNLKS